MLYVFTHNTRLFEFETLIPHNIFYKKIFSAKYGFISASALRTNAFAFHDIVYTLTLRAERFARNYLKFQFRVLKKRPVFGYNREQFVFMQENNKILCASTLNRHFKNSLKECGIDDIRFHDLRHSFATFLISKSIPPNAVSQILGHSKISTTLDIYTHEDFTLQKVDFDCINNTVNTSQN